MRTISFPQAAAALAELPHVPVLEAGDLPVDEDWTVVESLRFDRGFGSDADPDADRFDEVQIARGAFD